MRVAKANMERTFGDGSSATGCQASRSPPIVMRTRLLLFFASALAGCQTGRYLSIPAPSLADAELVVANEKAGVERGFRLQLLDESERLQFADMLGSAPIPASTLLEDVHAGRLFLVVGQIGHSGWITPWTAAIEIGEFGLELDDKRLLLDLGQDPLTLALDGESSYAVGPHPVIWRDRVFGLYWIEPVGTSLRLPQLNQR